MAYPGAPAEAELEGLKVRRLTGNLRAHVAFPLGVLRSGGWDIIVDDLAHVIPWTPFHQSRIPVIHFFRHLHARTLPGQVNAFAAALLRRTESLYRFSLRRGTFVTESRSSESDLISLGIPIERIRRIPPGVDHSVFAPSYSKSTTPTLVYFSGLRPYKRPDHAIEVVRILRDRGTIVQLMVAGEGNQRGQLSEVARRLRVENQVHFQGRLGLDSLARTVSESWVNVNCSVSEGWGYSALEAMACGVPTVGYAVPGLSEVVDATCGCLVKDGDIDALARGIEVAIERRDEWGKRGISRAQAYSWETSADNWEHYLSSMASSVS